MLDVHVSLTNGSQTELTGADIREGAEIVVGGFMRDTE